MSETKMNNTSYIAKTRIKPVRKKFMAKVVSRQITLYDALEGHFRSSLSIFIPKLTPKHNTPRVMLHASNGSGSCLMRIKDPSVLADSLEELVSTLRSDRWVEAWWRISDISRELIDNNQIQLNEEIVDINAWHRALETTMDIELVQVKKELCVPP